MVRQVISSCSALTKLIFPENLYSIGREAFDDCESLKYLYIPETVSFIGKQAFMGCEKLETVCIDCVVRCILHLTHQVMPNDYI